MRGGVSLGIRGNRYGMPHRRGDRGTRHRVWAGRGMGSLTPLRTGTTRHWHDRKPPKDDIEALNRKARAIEARLQYLNARIREIERGHPPLKFLAIVDAEKCTGCGMCMDACPTGAALLKEVVRIDPKRCVGCGCCVEICPQGALSLHSVEPGLSSQTERVL
jgi:ferredoxin